MRSASLSSVPEPPPRVAERSRRVLRTGLRSAVSALFPGVLGIDTAAHEATLAAGGRPVGVLGTGINRVYPAQNRHLHERIAVAGALLSQFLPNAPPGKAAFRMRNATISGLGRASVIVEAGEYSGSRTWRGCLSSRADR
jgi:predicted Rossmann fold nucleotide-binding protein DprA/Smf involved in DNA uptake